jgi:phosphotransferase system HPr (HPr) family protein
MNDAPQPAQAQPIEARVTIINKRGLHARAAARFATLSSSYTSQISVRHETRQANGKSIMSLMMLAAPLGSTLHLRIEGTDRAALLDALEKLIAARFDEAE